MDGEGRPTRRLRLSSERFLSRFPKRTSHPSRLEIVSQCLRARNRLWFSAHYGTKSGCFRSILLTRGRISTGSGSYPQRFPTRCSCRHGRTAHGRWGIDNHGFNELCNPWHGDHAQQRNAHVLVTCTCCSSWPSTSSTPARNAERTREDAMRIGSATDPLTETDEDKPARNAAIAGPPLLTLKPTAQACKIRASASIRLLLGKAVCTQQTG